MADKEGKKIYIDADNVNTVIQRYSADTVLALLKEMHQDADEKMDWKELVRKSSTGITNAREYQMLWRYLAYGAPLDEAVDDDAKPLEDDSDIECEVEVMPPVPPEVSAEAAACVKVLTASGLPSKSVVPKGLTATAPMTKNMPSGKATRAPPKSLQHSRFVNGTDHTVPVSAQKQKQTLPAVRTAERLNINGLDNNNLPLGKKRKRWSDAEDKELIAAVKKYGEGYWAHISEGDFKSERSASQLSKRWNFLKKCKDNSSLGGSSQVSEAHRAAHHAMSIALSMPMNNKLKASSSPDLKGAEMSSAPIPDYVHPTAIGIKPDPQFEIPKTMGFTTKQDSLETAPQQSIVLGLSSPVNLKAQPTKPSHGLDELFRDTAVAVGGRIATPSEAESLLKVAQGYNVAYGGASKVKASMTDSNSLPSNVHFIRTGLATTNSTYSPLNASRFASTQPITGRSDLRQSSPKLNVASEAPRVANSDLVLEGGRKILADIVQNYVDTAYSPENKASTLKDKDQNQTAFCQDTKQENGQGVNGPEKQIEDDTVSITGEEILELIEKVDCGDDNEDVEVDICN